MENNIEAPKPIVNGKMVGFNGYLGLEVLKSDNGHSEVKLDIRPEFFNHMKSLHGGLLFTIADVAGGVAVRAAGEVACTTMSSNIVYMSPGIGTKTLYAYGDVLKHGRKTTISEVLVTDENGKKLIKMTATYFNLSGDLKTK